MSQDLLEYSKMMEKAVRGVLREALSIAAEHGLPGLHHFYITFRTGAPGVSISDQLRAQHPNEMTIVLENQFWDLEVSEEKFAVSLSFNRTQQRLVVPFEAVTAFVDPSVKFGLQFGQDATAGHAADPDVGAPRAEADQSNDEPLPPATAGDGEAGDPADDGDDRVVTLDSFRKK
jgi:hypothetical protein